MEKVEKNYTTLVKYTWDFTSNAGKEQKKKYLITPVENLMDRRFHSSCIQDKLIFLVVDEFAFIKNSFFYG